MSFGVSMHPIASRSSASVTIEKPHGADISRVTVDLSVSGSEFGINIRDDIARDLEPSTECAAVYTSAERLYRACLAGASAGVMCASRPFREACGRVTYERLRGARLPAACATGFEIAASIALLRALSRPDQLSRSMDGWRIVS